MLSSELESYSYKVDELSITAICGGSGSVSLIDELLKCNRLLKSITGVYDNGGHSGLIRTVLGLLPPGDATHQLAVHIRNIENRKLLTERWTGDNDFNGKRPGNDLLALAEHITGSHSKGIQYLEGFFADYEGRVIPISDDNRDLVIYFDDGSQRIGEREIDELKDGDPKITTIGFHPNPPKANDEALTEIANSDIVIIPPGTFYGSILPILMTPGVREAVMSSNAYIAWYCNAINTRETLGYKAEDFAGRLVDALGRPINTAFINRMRHNLPESYIEEGAEVVENGLEPSNELVENVIHTPLTRLHSIGGKLTIRHDGEASIKSLLNDYDDYLEAKKAA